MHLVVKEIKELRASWDSKDSMEKREKEDHLDYLDLLARLDPREIVECPVNKVLLDPKENLEYLEILADWEEEAKRVLLVDLVLDLQDLKESLE